MEIAIVQCLIIVYRSMTKIKKRLKQKMFNTIAQFGGWTWILLFFRVSLSLSLTFFLYLTLLQQLRLLGYCKAKHRRSQRPSKLELRSGQENRISGETEQIQMTAFKSWWGQETEWLTPTLRLWTKIKHWKFFDLSSFSKLIRSQNLLNTKVSTRAEPANQGAGSTKFTNL